MTAGPADGHGMAMRAPGVGRDLLIVAIGLLLLLAWDASGLDMPLIRHFGTPQGFPWRDEWLTSHLLHKGGRNVSIVLAVLTLAACLRPFGPWRGLSRQERVWWLVVTMVCLVLIPQIKRYSATSCPWDLQEFGGVAQHLSHWRGLFFDRLADGGPGRCFPSGHASGAFSFLAIGLVLRRANPRLCAAWVVGLTLLGLVFGVAQMARGAHFASHTFYTAWICAAITLLSWHLLPRTARSQPTQGWVTKR